MKFKGWKTYVGALLLVGSVVFKVVGYPEVAEAVLVIGGAFGLIGIRHKMGRMIIEGAVDRAQKGEKWEPENTALKK